MNPADATTSTPLQATAWVEVDLVALRHNLALVKSLAPGQPVLAMLKADAYGHGLLPVAAALADEVDAIAVARLDEAQRLRSAGYSGAILLLAAWLDRAELQWCAAHGVWVMVHDQSLLERLAGTALSNPLTVWLKLNTGMNRLGFAPTQAATAWQRLTAMPAVSVPVIMTHLARADDGDPSAVAAQLRGLQASIPTGFRGELSIANSAGLIAHPEARRGWLRPGVMLFGENPTDQGPLDLRPVMHLKARVVGVHSVVAGSAVGYGGDWIASHDSLIATAGIGYGDGYPRHVAAGTVVAIGGQRLPLAGRVSMDLIGIDVSQRPQTRPGDVVSLWGDEPSMATIAQAAGTISYELMTQVQGRVPRIYRPVAPE